MKLYKKTKSAILLVLAFITFTSCTSDGKEENDTNKIPTIPKVETKDVTKIKFKSVETGGVIIDNGNARITKKGVLITKKGTPTLENSLDINISFLGNTSEYFNIILEGLEPETNYNIRAYAVNEVGVGYGNIINFTTTELLIKGNGVVDIDNNRYPTIIYNDSEWSTKNLEVEHYRNGDVIPQVQDPVEWSKLTTGAWCYYENDTEIGKICGKLYNYYAVIDPRGLAPVGWHVAKLKDYRNLIIFLKENFKCGSPHSSITMNNLGKIVASTILWRREGGGCFYVFTCSWSFPLWRFIW